MCDMQSCSNYRGITLISHTMKVMGKSNRSYAERRGKDLLAAIFSFACFKSVDK